MSYWEDGNPTWNLWLDDIRNPLKSDKRDITREYIWARDPETAIYFVMIWGPPAFMSLDHDLGYDRDNIEIDCFDFLEWLAEHHYSAPPDYRVISDNVPAQERIVSFMESWKKSLQMGN